MRSIALWARTLCDAVELPEGGTGLPSPVGGAKLRKNKLRHYGNSHPQPGDGTCTFRKSDTLLK